MTDRIAEIRAAHAASQTAAHRDWPLDDVGFLLVEVDHLRGKLKACGMQKAGYQRELKALREKSIGG